MILERGLLGMPIPPAPPRLALRSDVARHSRPVARNLAQDSIEDFLETLMPCSPPSRQERLPVALKTEPPIWVELHRYDRGVVCPMLEKCTIFLQQTFELPRLVRLIAGEKDHMMRPRHCIDAVDLDKAERPDQLTQARIR